LEGERLPTKELKMTSNQLCTTLLAAALVAATSGIALAQGSGSVGGGAVTESPQPGTGASGAAGPAAPSGTVRGSATTGSTGGTSTSNRMGTGGSDSSSATTTGGAASTSTPNRMGTGGTAKPD
jgi:hypothetical protein